jgi:metal-responsive CopG/Arc/MetJ family transcriptional regulator
METIQIVLDAKLLRAADKAAKQQKVNRSALIRYALQEHLRQLREKELEIETALAIWLARSVAKNTACGRTSRNGPKAEPR